MGRVGTGFSHAAKVDMLQNKEKYIGSVAKIQSSRQMPSGAFFQPAFKEWHMDKGKQTVKLAELALEKYIDNFGV